MTRSTARELLPPFRGSNKGEDRWRRVPCVFSPPSRAPYRSSERSPGRGPSRRSSAVPPKPGWISSSASTGRRSSRHSALSLGFWFSVVLALCVFAVAAVLARRYIRTVPFAVAIGAVIGGWASNFLERVSTGAVVDYLAVGAGRVHLIANVPDIAVLAGVFGTAVLVFGPRHWREPRARKGA